MTQLHQTFQNKVFYYTQETQKLFDDLHTQLNNSNSRFKLFTLKQTRKFKLFNSNHARSPVPVHDLLSTTTQAILTRINSYKCGNLWASIRIEAFNLTMRIALALRVGRLCWYTFEHNNIIGTLFRWELCWHNYIMGAFIKITRRIITLRKRYLGSLWF